MIEYYAKIVPVDKGMFRYCVTIWKSHDGIESIWDTKKFMKIDSARNWAETRLTMAVSEHTNVIFIKESDILRRKWND